MPLEMGIQAVVSHLTWVLGTQLSPLQEQHTFETAESHPQPPEFDFKIGLVIPYLYSLSLTTDAQLLPAHMCRQTRS